MKHGLFIFLLLLGIGGKAQDELLRKLTSEVPDCELLDQNAMQLIPSYVEEGKMDSALAAYAYWDKHCPNYYVLSFRLLLAIKYDSLASLNDLLQDLEFIDWYAGRHFLDGRPFDKPETRYTEPDLPWYERQMSPAERTYWNFIRGQAEMESRRLNKGAWPYLMARFLAHDEQPLFEALEKEQIQVPVTMHRNYKDMEREEMNKPRAEAGVYGVAWLPQGNLATLGIHPGAGLRVGFSKNLWRAMLNLNFNFLRSANAYRVLQADTPFTTSYFLGSYVGGEFGRVLYYSQKHEWAAHVGVAYHGIQATENTAPEEEASNAIHLNSLDLNAGLEYRYYYSKTSFFGLGAVYHYNTFSNEIDNSLDGNSISLRLIWGFSSGTSSYTGSNNFGLR